MKEFIYRKGDVFLADLGIPHGSEQGGRRPVVIIQNDDGCVYSPTVTMVPMTTEIKKPFQKSHYILRYSYCIRYRSMVEAEQIPARQELMNRQIHDPRHSFPSLNALSAPKPYAFHLRQGVISSVHLEVSLIEAQQD